MEEEKKEWLFSHFLAIYFSVSLLLCTDENNIHISTNWPQKHLLTELIWRIFSKQIRNQVCKKQKDQKKIFLKNDSRNEHSSWIIQHSELSRVIILNILYCYCFESKCKLISKFWSNFLAFTIQYNKFWNKQTYGTLCMCTMWLLPFWFKLAIYGFMWILATSCLW